MSERLTQRTEHSSEHSHEAKKRQENIRHAAEKKAETARHEHAENIGEIRSKIEKASRSKEEHQQAEQEQDKKHGSFLVNKELKSLAYRRTLKKTQSKLPAPARVFSRVVHNPVVDAVSETAGKTIARPSGVLAGGIFAFIGSGLFLWVARHYGYEYNFLLFAIFFAGGFFFGLLVELAIKLSAKKRLR